jgi:hypothetical protein
MQGADSITTLRAIAGRIESPIEYVDLERALDEVEYLCQWLDPELSHLANAPGIAALRPLLQWIRET